MKAMVIKTATYHEYLNKTEPYLRNIIIDLQNSEAQKMQLTIATNFIS